jgi:hypothetical protein
LLTVLLASLASGDLASAAEVQVDEFIARAGPARMTESNVAIEGGVVYRMEISGTMQSTDYGITTNSDAVYCFSSSTGSGCEPTESMCCTVAYSVDKSYKGLGGTQSFADFQYEGYKVPPYDDGHRYELKFRSEIDGSGKLYVVTHPVKDEGEATGIGGQFTVRLFREEAKKPPPGGGGGTTGGAPQFGVAAGFVAPAPGSGVLLSSPKLPSGLKKLSAAFALSGTAPGRTFAVSKLRITDGKKLAAVCAIWGNISIPAAQLQLPGRYPTSAAQNTGIFNTCAKALLDRVAGAPPPKSSCRLTLVPVTLAGTRLTSRQRRAAISFAQQNLASSCSSGGDGRLGLRLQGRTKQATMRGLLGPQMPLGVVRGRTSQADGASPTLAVRWSR